MLRKVPGVPYSQVCCMNCAHASMPVLEAASVHGGTNLSVVVQQGKSVHCGFDPEGQGSAANDPKDQIFHGRR